MKPGYLEWYKIRMPRIHVDPGVSSFLSSSVPEPWDLIHDLLDRNQEKFRNLLNIPNPWGHPELLSIIAEKYAVHSENIVLTQGATNAIYLLCQTLLKPGDHVVVENPFYQPLRDTPELLGAEVEHFQRDSLTGTVDMASLENTIRSDTRLLIVTNTHNPSGAILRDEDLLSILSVATKKNPSIRILVDEVYLDYLEHPPAAAYTLDPRFITVSSLTKAYGLSFLRCGWICSDNTLCNEVRKRQVLVDGIGSLFLESLSFLVFSDLDRFLRRSLDRVNTNRNHVKEWIQPLLDRDILSGVIPEHGCICFLRMNTGNTVDATLKTLEIDHNLYLVPGRFFGDNTTFRLGFGGDTESLDRGLHRLNELLS